jgi:hypothetical protein
MVSRRAASPANTAADPVRCPGRVRSHTDACLVTRSGSDIRQVTKVICGAASMNADSSVVAAGTRKSGVEGGDDLPAPGSGQTRRSRRSPRSNAATSGTQLPVSETSRPGPCAPDPVCVMHASPSLRRLQAGCAHHARTEPARWFIRYRLRLLSRGKGIYRTGRGTASGAAGTQPRAGPSLAAISVRICT